MTFASVKCVSSGEVSTPLRRSACDWGGRVIYQALLEGFQSRIRGLDEVTQLSLC